ncbi:diaminopimelate decarboxylase [Dehalogenimonas etheniformans]|uniref:Diaminopimelate decarboxylase n=1 Tax=Dehalogenimonas etheniformans TaxID=1536648 RepID=A0A2P5P699_9CHLR|nr:diaminopimelate decarboxylase [Dehalogenimonas etheniformans]PPD57831.1 diaminopimelate decarboxylase [Dehalogenimonas etheniformans]QNT76094.1 diaminopimelate decarboxylase [Dehalogenimonas etheniformans]
MKNAPPFFPLNSSIDDNGHLRIGGLDAVALTKEFGTPLYVFDEDDIRERCREFKREFTGRYAATHIVFAGKACLTRAIAKIVASEGLGLDVVSGGELEIARSAGFPTDAIYFHGNNKSDAELEMALEYRVGRIVVDNSFELGRLETMAARRGVRADIMFRIKPGIDPHTHAKITTGNIDSKFGFGLDDASAAAAQAMKSKNLRLIGFHYHIGSQIFEIQPFLDAMKTTLEFMARMKRELGFITEELDTGGGYAIQYLSGVVPPTIGEYAEAIVNAFRDECRRLGLAMPKLSVEPGRATVARSAVALYSIGAIKDIPGIRRYACVDGGMADNIRPALYCSQYEPYLANRMSDFAGQTYTIAGRFCESGDILATDIKLPEVKRGDILVMPVCGAYCIPMSSNYNAFYRPAMVMIKDGKARLIRRRETVEDLTRTDLG